MKYKNNKIELENEGYSIIFSLFSDKEISEIICCIEEAEKKDSSFLRTKDLFAIRQLMNVIPELKGHIFNHNFSNLLSDLGFSEKSLTKAIYFDKPSSSNWFVAYHQDLSISVDQKTELENYSKWTFKKGQHGVQPPVEILENTTTIRIHLDKTNEKNGALKVIPGSHLNGVYRAEFLDKKTEQICSVEKGGVMLMKPLTFHASSRTINNKRRRVIHMEFCNHQLAKPLNWLERMVIK